MSIDDSSIDIVEEVVDTDSVSTYMVTPPFHLTCTRINPCLHQVIVLNTSVKYTLSIPVQSVAQSFQGEGVGRERSRRSRREVEPHARPRREIGNVRLTRQGQSLQNLKYADCNSCILKTLYTSIECFHSRGQHLCEFIRTKESVCIRKEYTSRRMPGHIREFNRLEPHSSHDLFFKIWRNNKTEATSKVFCL